MALLFFEAILFGLFTLAMFTEQVAPAPRRPLHEARPARGPPSPPPRPRAGLGADGANSGRVCADLVDPRRPDGHRAAEE